MGGMLAWWRRTVEAARESSWRLPLLGAAGGVGLALGFGLAEGLPGDVGWTLTIGEGRGTLLSWLSILFAAFSIVLAVATMTAQNTLGKYSARMYRLYDRNDRETVVLSLFALTASYIVTEQILLRGADPDEVVPATGFMLAFVLLIATGVAMIWYLTTATAWFRVERVAGAIAQHVADEAAVADLLRRDVAAASQEAFQRPRDGVPIRARASGYLVEPDPHELIAELAGSTATAVIASSGGSPVVVGEEIGWVVGPVVESGSGGEAGRLAERVGQLVETEEQQGVTGAMVGYGIVVLVDTAIMALSPAVNDPNTAVQIIGTMTFLYTDLADHELGSYEMRSSRGTPAVIVRSPSFAEYFRLGTTQILLYGKGDPAVQSALDRMVRSLLSLDLAATDRAEVEAFGKRVQMAAAQIMRQDSGSAVMDS